MQSSTSAREAVPGHTASRVCVREDFCGRPGDMGSPYQKRDPGFSAERARDETEKLHLRPNTRGSYRWWEVIRMWGNKVTGKPTSESLSRVEVGDDRHSGESVVASFATDHEAFVSGMDVGETRLREKKPRSEFLSRVKVG